MQRRSLRALLLFLAFYVCFGILLFIFQERLIYQPGHAVFTQCDTLPEEYQPITHRGTRMYSNATSGEPIAVLYHGNAGNACDRAFYAPLFAAAGYRTLLVSYTGYAPEDARTPSHAHVQTDVANVVDYLEIQDVAEVAVVGESIGTGPAALHATLASPEKLILLSPFADLRTLAATHFWFYPFPFLVHNPFPPAELLSTYRGDVLIIHGTDDEIIPPRFSSIVADAIPSTVIHIRVPDATHNTLFHYATTTNTIVEFLGE